MEDAIKLFTFNDVDIRVFINENKEPEFCASDVTSILGYNNGRDAILKHCTPKGVAKRDTLTQGGLQPLTYISEGNLYRLILKSNKPEAEPFERFVCDEVLPTIRRHGAYMTAEALERTLTDPDNLILLLTVLKNEQNERSRLQGITQIQRAELEIQAPKVMYHDRVIDSNSLITITELSNELGYPSAIKLNQALKAMHILRKVNGNWALCAQYSGLGYAQYRTLTYTDSKGQQQTKHNLCWTELGRKFLHQTLKSNKQCS